MTKYMPKVYKKKFYLRLTATTRELPKLESQTKQDREREQRDLQSDEGTIPSHNINNHTDAQQGNHNSPTKLERAIKKYVNNLHNDPTKFPQQAEQFDDTYFDLLQTTTQTLHVMTAIAKDNKRKADW
eukprot:4457892-Amphidinium_carterae.2